jgi:hypothetical protein
VSGHYPARDFLKKTENLLCKVMHITAEKFHFLVREDEKAAFWRARAARRSWLGRRPERVAIDATAGQTSDS